MTTKPVNNYRAYGHFAMAIFYYVALTFELLTGVIPRGSGDPAKFYQNNSGFFWIYISIIFAFFAYQLARGIATYINQRNGPGAITEKPKSFTPRTAGNITAAVAISIGICLFILPVVEAIKATVYGGYVFKTHQFSIEPGLFVPLLAFHLIVTFLPIFGGILLLAFPPKITIVHQPLIS